MFEITTTADEIACYITDLVITVLVGMGKAPTVDQVNRSKRLLTRQIQANGLKDAPGNLKITKEVLQAIKEVEQLRKNAKDSEGADQKH